MQFIWWIKETNKKDNDILKGCVMEVNKKKKLYYKKHQRAYKYFWIPVHKIMSVDVYISQHRLNNAVTTNNLKSLSDLQNKGLFFSRYLPIWGQEWPCLFIPYPKGFVL